MRKTALTLAIAALTAVAACKKTGENEFQVQTPDVDVKTDTSTIKTPDVDIVKDTAKIGDLQDPGAKMSKSASTPNGLIELLEPTNRIAKKIKSAVTDTGREIVFDPANKPGVSNLLTIYSALTGRTIDDLTAAYAGKGYGDLKKDLAEVVVEFVQPIQQRTRAFLDDPAQLDKLLAIGGEKARAVSAVTLTRAYDRVGFVAPG